MPLQQLLLRLLTAAVLGSLVGLERERLEWAAGLRTHMLVCLGACLFMIVSAYGFSGVLGRPAVVLDPSRVAAQVVTGIGFLCAGTILMRGEVIRGLTTAASVWSVAAVGLAVGGGLYWAAVGTTALIVIILAGIKPLERRIFLNRQLRTLTLVVNSGEARLLTIEEAAARIGLNFTRMLVRKGDVPNQDRIEVTVGRARREQVLALVETLRGVEGVREVQFASED